MKTISPNSSFLPIVDRKLPAPPGIPKFVLVRPDRSSTHMVVRTKALILPIDVIWSSGSFPFASCVALEISYPYGGPRRYAVDRVEWTGRNLIAYPFQEKSHRKEIAALQDSGFIALRHRDSDTL